MRYNMLWKYFKFKDNELYIQVWIFLLLGMLDGITCRKVTVVPVREDITAPLLTCWTCSHSKNSPNKECIKLKPNNNITKSVCKLHESFCKIQRLEADGKVEQIERSCTKNCNPGCHRYQTYKRCDSCCSQPLCNERNDADSVQNSSISKMFGVLFATVMNYLRMK